METITLNNGVDMPALGLGVFQTPPDENRAAVKADGVLEEEESRVKVQYESKVDVDLEPGNVYVQPNRNRLESRARRGAVAKLVALAWPPCASPSPSRSPHRSMTTGSCASRATTCLWCGGITDRRCCAVRCTDSPEWRIGNGYGIPWRCRRSPSSAVAERVRLGEGGPKARVLRLLLYQLGSPGSQPTVSDEYPAPADRSPVCGWKRSAEWRSARITIRLR